MLTTIISFQDFAKSSFFKNCACIQNFVVMQFTTALAALFCNRRVKPSEQGQLMPAIALHEQLQPRRLERTALAPPEKPSQPGRRSHTSLAHEGHSSQLDRLATLCPLDQYKNTVRIAGNLVQMRTVRKTLKNHGFLNKLTDEKFPLNGHWETEHGMRVVIEGKMVRWSQTRASQLQFMGADKGKCLLSIYGETTVGRVVQATMPGTRTVLKWTNGDVWHSMDGCCIYQAMLLSQTMTKVLREDSQDEAVRACLSQRLRLLSRSGFGLLPDCLDHIKQFIGSTTFYVNINFNTKEGPPWMTEESRSDFLDSLSRHHSKVEFHHCWANEATQVHGVRTARQGMLAAHHAN